MSELFEAIKEGGPVARAAGMEIEQFSAIAGKLADAGIKGGRAGTTIKNAILRMQAPVPKARKRFREMGISLVDSNGNMKDFTVLIDEMNKKLPQGAKRAQVLNDIFGKIPIAGVNVLLSQGGQALRDYTEQLKNTGGFVDELADKMRDNLDGRLKTMHSSIEALRIELFKAFAPTLELIVQLITKITLGFIWLIDKLGPFKGIIADIALSLGVAATALGVLSAAFIVVNGAIAVFNALFVASPIGWIALAIGGIVLVIILLVKHFDKLRMAAKFVFDFIFAGVVGIIQILAKLLSFVPFVGSALKKLGDAGQMEIEADAKLRLERDNDSVGKDVINPDIAKAENDSTESRITREEISKSSAEVTIRDESGRAEVTKSDIAPGAFKMEFLPSSWAF